MFVLPKSLFKKSTSELHSLSNSDVMTPPEVHLLSNKVSGFAKDTFQQPITRSLPCGLCGLTNNTKVLEERKLKSSVLQSLTERC